MEAMSFFRTERLTEKVFWPMECSDALQGECGRQSMHLMSIFAFDRALRFELLMNFANQMVWLKLSRWKRPLALHTPTSVVSMEAHWYYLLNDVF